MSNTNNFVEVSGCLPRDPRGAIQAPAYEQYEDGAQTPVVSLSAASRVSSGTPLTLTVPAGALVLTPTFRRVSGNPTLILYGSNTHLDGSASGKGGDSVMLDLNGNAEGKPIYCAGLAAITFKVDAGVVQVDQKWGMAGKP